MSSEKRKHSVPSEYALAMARELTDGIEAYAWDDDFKFVQKTVPRLANAIDAARADALEQAALAVEHLPSVGFHAAKRIRELKK